MRFIGAGSTPPFLIPAFLFDLSVKKLYRLKGFPFLNRFFGKKTIFLKQGKNPPPPFIFSDSVCFKRL